MEEKLEISGDIFKRPDGGPVEPPEPIRRLLDDVKVAVHRWFETRDDADVKSAFGWMLKESAITCAAEVVSWDGCEDSLFCKIKDAVDRYISGQGEPENFPDMVEQWGGCPRCHQNHGYLFFDANIHMVCRRHHLCWAVAYGLFSEYLYYTKEALVTEKLELIFGYEPTKAWHPNLSSQAGQSRESP